MRLSLAVLVAILLILSGCSTGLNPLTSPTPSVTPMDTSTDTPTPTSTATPTPIPDSDGDGLNNQQEAELGTDPESPDTDNDTLTDYEEAMNLSTRPLEADTSGDGIPDNIGVSYDRLNATHHYPANFSDTFKVLHFTNETLARKWLNVSLAEHGEVTDSALALLKHIYVMEYRYGIGNPKRGAIAQSIHDGSIDQTDLEITAFLAESPGRFAEKVLSDAPYNGGWDRDNDSLLTGAEENVYRTNASSPDPEISGIVRALSANTSYTENDVDSAQKLASYLQKKDRYKEGVVSEWEQAREVGLIEDVIEDGDVSDKELEMLLSEDGDILLAQYEEEVVGTDPSASDTDGDSFGDDEEVFLSEALPGADPLRKDIYVEIDYMLDYHVPQSEFAIVKSEFENAPVNNSDGSEGINLHLIRDDEVPFTRVLEADAVSEYEDKYRDRGKEGYHHALLVNELKSERRDGETVFLSGFGSRGTFVVAGSEGPERTGHIFMHELGHSIGLEPSDFEGIDSTEISFHKYPSVMNYNAPVGSYGYSDGTNSDQDFDDWGHIEGTLYTPFTEDLTLIKEEDD